MAELEKRVYRLDKRNAPRNAHRQDVALAGLDTAMTHGDYQLVAVIRATKGSFRPLPERLILQGSASSLRNAPKQIKELSGLRYVPSQEEYSEQI